MPRRRTYEVDDPQLVTVDEVAEQMRVSADFVRKRCRDDDWPHLVMPWKGSHRYLFTPEHVELIVESMTPAPIPLRRPRRTTTAAPAPRKRARS